MADAPAPTRRLILVKHSLPTVAPNVPAPELALSTEGRQRCTALAARLRAYSLTVIAASDEPKATETAQLLALDHDLREHERRASDFYADQEEFHQAVRTLFARPHDHVFGTETAHAALTRFAAAVDRLIVGTLHGDLIVVAHGTAISLFVAARARLLPFPL